MKPKTDSWVTGWIVVEHRFHHPAEGPFDTEAEAQAYMNSTDARGRKVIALRKPIPRIGHEIRPLEGPPLTDDERRLARRQARIANRVPYQSMPGHLARPGQDDIARDPDAVRRCGCGFDYHLADCPIHSAEVGARPEGIFEPGDDDLDPHYDGDEDAR